MDLAANYRSLVRLHFPNAHIVADRFHVIRIINHHFLACWKEIDAVGSKNRGLLSLLRRHRHNLRANSFAWPLIWPTIPYSIPFTGSSSDFVISF